ncbi:MAG TPA: carboxypeptidase regulatory-like domain-containing protein [Pyrinomonadaceae bacterium]|nr:carboxypeptidase regulatory-like domain-containing protein [Pyrinomonadaceae bacterium]
MRNAPARAAFALLAALVCGAGARTALAQTPAAKEAPAAVEGRVTDGEKGLAGVAVALLVHTPGGGLRTALRAKTDQDGRYRITGAPPGRYQLTPVAPVFVLEGGGGYPPGRPLTLDAGETVEGFDFRLTRGGVITGRVADADGRPLVGEQVYITPADPPPPGTETFFFPRNNITDDRGIYRVYGLPPGRYRVSVGQDGAAGLARTGRSGRYYRRTFHPAAAEESQARVVEVAAGGEATDVDITLGQPMKTYRASGRFVSADGRPAPGVTFGFGPLEGEAQQLGMFEYGITADARGEFLIENLAPGRYAVFAAPADGAPSDFYSDAVTFEVDDADVSGLEVRLRRAATVSGVVHIEGSTDPARVARLLRQVKLFGHVEATSALGAPSHAQAAVGPDGGFRLTGLRPGKLRFGLGWPQVPGLTFARVEVNGTEARDGVEVGDGAQVAGVRVVLVYGNSVVRGQVNLSNGALAPEARLVVFARRAGSAEPFGGGSYGKGAEADARGRFVMEGLSAGDYEFAARVFTPQGPRQQGPRVPVTVPENGEATVTLTLDLSAGNR